MMRFAFLFSILLCCFPLAAAPAANPVIVVVGDSLSAGYGMELGQAWPSLLQQRLDEQGYKYQVLNASIAGETTRGGRERLPRLLREYRPAIVLIELGGNDGLRGLPPDVARGNLAAMVEAGQAAGAQVLVAEMRIPPNYGRSYRERFNAIWPDLETRYGVTVLPFILRDIALQPELMQQDGIHPTAQAQPRILEQVWVVLKPMLQAGKPDS